jgi:uncharacterized membrane protein YoaK (UPF0700 family)
VSIKSGDVDVRYRNWHIFQLREIGLALTFIGGFIDAYTFVERGGVLAAGQTGNLIFLSVNIAQGDMTGVLTKLATVVAFMLGVVAVRILEYHVKPHSHYWRSTILIAELVVCLVVSQLPHSVPNFAVTPPLAFVMAMQTTAFSYIAGRGYNNVFSTGNLKKATSAVATYWMTRDKKQLTTGIVYFELVFAFAIGAIVSALLQKVFNTQTIIFAAILVFIVGIYYDVMLFKRQHSVDDEKEEF